MIPWSSALPLYLPAFLANNSALPHAEALPGAWDAKAGTYTVTDASRAAVQTFLSVSPASGNDASLREP